MHQPQKGAKNAMTPIKRGENGEIILQGKTIGDPTIIQSARALINKGKELIQSGANSGGQVLEDLFGPKLYQEIKAKLGVGQEENLQLGKLSTLAALAVSGLYLLPSGAVDIVTGGQQLLNMKENPEPSILNLAEGGVKIGLLTYLTRGLLSSNGVKLNKTAYGIGGIVFIREVIKGLQGSGPLSWGPIGQLLRMMRDMWNSVFRRNTQQTQGTANGGLPAALAGAR